jgi:carbonic anhydrase
MRGLATPNFDDYVKAMTLFTDMIDGYGRFRTEDWVNERERWSDLGEGQSPKVMVIACSDSRVDPTQIFDTKPGEIFVVRNVAALVPPFETTPGLHGVSAALEFAVQFLKVEEILVMGHGFCGGCQAALSKAMVGMEPGEGGFVANWISLLDDAQAEVVARFGPEGAEAERAMEMAAVKVSLANLRTFPCIRQKEASGELALHGAVFSISDGKLHVLDEDVGTFAAV